MTTITPPPPPPPPTAAAAPPPPPVVIVANPPQALTQLNIGAILEAAIAGRIGKEQIILQTPYGQLTAQTPLALPAQGSLGLQLQAVTPAVQFLITSIDGKPVPHQALRHTEPGLPTPPSGGRAAAAGARAIPPGPLASGTVVQAHLLRPLPTPPGPPTFAAAKAAVTGPGVPPPGSASTAQNAAPAAADRLAAAIKAGPATAKGPGPALSGGADAATLKTATGSPSKGAPGPLQNPPSVAAATIGRGSVGWPAGTPFSVRLIAVQPASPIANTQVNPTQPVPGTGLVSGQVVSGTVTGSTASGHPIVHTPDGVFSLATQAAPPRGSVLTLEIVKFPPPAGASLTPVEGAPSAASMLDSRRWPALEEAVQTLKEVNPQAAHQLLNNAIPRPDNSLAAGILFFLSALRAGNLRTFFGEDTMRLLERTRPGLHGRLTDDFKSLRRMADDSSSGDWRIVLIPLSDGSELMQARMMMRNYGGAEEEEEAKPEGTRFILDVELTRLGHLQLDGLVAAGGKRLDLIVRNEGTLSPEMRNDIRTIFHDAAALTGISGGVVFQATPPNFVAIADPASPGAFGLVV